MNEYPKGVIVKEYGQDARSRKIVGIVNKLKNKSRGKIPIDQSPADCFDEDGKRKERSDKGGTRDDYASKLPFRYKSYVQRANRKGIAFVFSIGEFNSIIGMDCVYCGKSSAGGIDRVNSSDGYTHENSVPSCSICNMMKYSHDHEFFLNHVKKIYNNLNSKGVRIDSSYMD